MYIYICISLHIYITTYISCVAIHIYYVSVLYPSIYNIHTYIIYSTILYNCFLLKVCQSRQHSNCLSIGKSRRLLV